MFDFGFRRIEIKTSFEVYCNRTCSQQDNPTRVIITDLINRVWEFVVDAYGECFLETVYRRTYRTEGHDKEYLWCANPEYAVTEGEFRLVAWKDVQHL